MSINCEIFNCTTNLGWGSARLLFMTLQQRWVIYFNPSVVFAIFKYIFLVQSHSLFVGQLINHKLNLINSQIPPASTINHQRRNEEIRTRGTRSLSSSLISGYSGVFYKCKLKKSSSMCPPQFITHTPRERERDNCLI